MPWPEEALPRSRSQVASKTTSLTFPLFHSVEDFACWSPGSFEEAAKNDSPFKILYPANTIKVEIKRKLLKIELRNLRKSRFFMKSYSC